MSWILSTVLIGVVICVPVLFGPISAVSGRRGAFAIGTLLLAASTTLLTATWPAAGSVAVARQHRWRGVLVVAVGIVLLAAVAIRLLPAVFSAPPDPYRGDMLVTIEDAITKFLAGGNPYAVYQVPWDVSLSYGPTLWMPYVAPHLLNTDPRILSLAAQLVVPAACFLAAGRRAADGGSTRAALLFAAGALIAMSPDIRAFYPIGHTQIYWPLLLLFCLLMAGSRWTAAAVCLGLLVGARTTLVALVPVFFLHLLATGSLRPRHAIAFVLSALLPFAPFVLADADSLRYGMFDVYLKVMKGYVWQSTTWAVETYGVTGRLLESGLERYVEIVQLASLGITYGFAWRALRQGARPEPWMALALLVFSMTTLWSVIYLYFDVWVLLTSALVARDGFATASRRQSVGTVTAIAAGALAIVLGAAAWNPGSRYTLDIGDPATAGLTGGGFGRDVAVIDDDRKVVWIEDTAARIRLPRAAWGHGTIRIAIRPHMPVRGLDQRVVASLNDKPIGGVKLREGWQEIELTASRRQWRYGFNVLNLSFAYAIPGSTAGDTRALAAAVDRVTVE
jgi:hypothetical protein